MAPTPPVDATVVELLRAAIDEISTEPRSALLRMLAASIQTDEAVAQQFRERLLEPQLAQITELVAAAGYASPQMATELLLTPIFYRWFLRLPQLQDDELREHVERIFALARDPSINVSAQEKLASSADSEGGVPRSRDTPPSSVGQSPYVARSAGSTSGGRLDGIAIVV